MTAPQTPAPDDRPQQAGPEVGSDAGLQAGRDAAPQPASGDSPNRRAARRTVAAVLAVALAGSVGALLLGRRESATSPEALLGTPRSGMAWHSGAWTGERLDAASANAFGEWRGRPLDLITTYPERENLAQIAASNWHITTWTGFDGALAYGLPLLPQSSKEATFETVAAGDHDAIFTQVAKDLVAAGRGKSVVRVGWEANGVNWFGWGANAQTAEGYKKAFRHVVGVLHQTAPDLIIDFDIACLNPLQGSPGRLDALTKLYPGDDVVDIIGCDTYDAYLGKATNDAEWAKAIAPDSAPGIADLVTFAKARGKLFAIPEWGLTKTEAGGNGDNPYYIRKMHEFFDQHKDSLAFEAYFDEPGDTLRSSLWSTPSQNPNSAAEYQKLWKG